LFTIFLWRYIIDVIIKSINGECDMYEYFMNFALEEAKIAYMLDEVPVGCVIVRDGNIIARGHNLRETLKEATAHAEILAIKEACRALGGWRLPNCEMYVTLEPCPMCAGALVNARIERVIFGAYDLKAGSCGSVYNIANDLRLNHRLEIIGGVLEDECRKLLQDFFKMKRKKTE
jgi:tRNA(adenine34) deaminase